MSELEFTAQEVVVPEYPIHPLADEMSIKPETYADIKKNIEQFGYNPNMPIMLWNGQILDGRTRYKICQELGVVPTFETVDPEVNPLIFVIQANKRRDTRPSVKAMFGVEHLEEIEEIQKNAHDRKRSGNAQGGKTAGRGRPKKESDSSRETVPGTYRARDEIAEMLGCNPRYVDQAITIKNKGVPELKYAVLQGRLSLKDGVMAATKWTPEEQRELAQRATYSGDRFRNAGIIREIEERRRGPRKEEKEKKEDQGGNGEASKASPARKKALDWAYKAIDCLKEILPNNPNRADAYREVAKFIQDNL